MKKAFLTFISAFFLFASLPAASAETTVIYLKSKPHQLFDGTFRNDELAADLLSMGRLGKPLEQKRKGTRTWVIDAQLLDEVADMADGYKLANKQTLAVKLGQTNTRRFYVLLLVFAQLFSFLAISTSVYAIATLLLVPLTYSCAKQVLKGAIGLDSLIRKIADGFDAFFDHRNLYDDFWV